MTIEKFVEFEKKTSKVIEAQSYGNFYSDAYQSLLSLTVCTLTFDLFQFVYDCFVPSRSIAKTCYSLTCNDKKVKSSSPEYMNYMYWVIK